MRICTVVFDYRNLKRYDRLFSVWHHSVKASNPCATIDVLKIQAPELTGEHKASYESNTAKFNAWSEYLQDKTEPVILMDCDMMVLRDLSDAFEGDFDIGLTRTSRDTPPFNGGVVFVKPTKEAHDFIKLWQEVNEELFNDPAEHQKWGHWYMGMNQAALGKILETGLSKAKIKEFPCREWNACDSDWGQTDKATVRVIHYKSALRKVVLGETKKVPKAYEWEASLFKQMEGETPNIQEIGAYFKKRTGYTLDHEHPKTYMEKITAKKLKQRDPLLITTSDKIMVREYVKGKGLGDTVVPIVGRSVFPVKLPWQDLPPAFIIKMNNASGRNMVVENKLHIAQFYLEKKINEWLKQPYGDEKYEWAYQNIVPEVLVEPLLAGGPPKVYRLDTFGGKVGLLQVYRYKNDGSMLDITTSYLPWEPINVQWNARNIGHEAEPRKLSELIEKSEILGKDFEHVRVDWMEDSSGKLWFSELTHYPLSGMGRLTPVSYDLEFGRLWDKMMEVR